MTETQELWLNSPVGYPFAEKIAKSDVGRLKSFLINTTPDDLLQEMIRNMSHQQLIEDLERSGFTFDEEWYGVRELEGSL